MRKKSDARKRVADGLYRNMSSGLYSAHFRCNGRVIKKSLKTTELAVAKRKLRDLRDEVEQLDPRYEGETLRSLAERNLELVSHRAKKTVEMKERVFRSMIRHWPGPDGIDVLVSKVKPSDVELWLQRATKGTRIATRNEYLWSVKQVFDRGVRDGVISRSPADHLKAAKRESVDRRVPTRAQFQAIVDHVRKNAVANPLCRHSADFLEFMGLSGMGNAETRNLTRKDVDLDNDRIQVRRVKTDQRYYIPIFPQLRPLLMRLLDEADSSPDARLLKVDDARKSLVAACKKLNYPRFIQRSMRSMFITNALEKGVDVKVIAEWQGHQDGGRLILNTYSHVRRPHHDAMAKLMS